MKPMTDDRRALIASLVVQGGLLALALGGGGADGSALEIGAKEHERSSA